MARTEQNVARRRFSITLTLEQNLELDRIAKQKRVSRAWVVREAVQRYLDAQAPLFARPATGSWDAAE